MSASRTSTNMRSITNYINTHQQQQKFTYQQYAENKNQQQQHSCSTRTTNPAKNQTIFFFLFFLFDLAIFYFGSSCDFRLSGGEGHGLVGLATCIYHQLLIAWSLYLIIFIYLIYYRV